MSFPRRPLAVTSNSHITSIRSGPTHISPGLVDDLELLSLLGHLLQDVGAAEDGLEVLPCPLARQPVVHNLLQGHHEHLPGRGLSLERLDVRRGSH